MFEVVKSFVVPLNSLREIKKAFPDEENCIKYLELFRWNNKVVSPFSKTSKVYQCSNGKYRCKDTHKYFTVKTATVFDGTKVSLQNWMIAIIVYLNYEKDFGASLQYLKRHLTINPRTVWLLLNKIRYAVNHPAYHLFMRKLKVYPHFELMLQGMMKVPRK